MPEVGSESQRKVVRSAYSDGGGGFTFERRVAVRYLAAMVSGAARSELGDRRVVHVAFQQSLVAPVDDLHVLAARDGEEDPSLELWIACRRRPRFVQSDKDTKKLVRALVEAIGLPETRGRERYLVVCAAAGHNPTAQVAELADLARAKGTEESFLAEVAEGGRARRALRARYEHLDALVRDSWPEGPRVSVWCLLRQLHISMVQVESPDERDWADLLGELESWAFELTLTGAEALRSRLADLADEYDPGSAEVDRPKLCRDAHSVLHSDRRLLDAAWKELRRLEREARAAVRRECGSNPPVMLARNEARDELARYLGSGQVLLVSGESGVGKSALVCSALDHLVRVGLGEFESLYLNLRHLPRRPAELRAELGAPLDRIFSEMSAPRSLLVVDAADSSAETEATSLAAIVRDAVTAGVAVCVVSASGGSATVEGVVSEAMGESPQRHTVPTLTDDEIEELARGLPALQRMVTDNRSRELLRRPAFADYLAQSGGCDTPLSESAAMDVIWSQLVRGERRELRSAQDSRDQAMRKLARQLLEPLGSDELYASLDVEALDRLRRDGAIRDSASSWSPLPVFAHDILRDFAVAKVLGSDGNPAKRIGELGAPRWALPAARLAFEMVLGDSQQGSTLLSELQRLCDELAAFNAGERWVDLPVEAALGLPDADEILAGSWDRLVAEGGSGLSRVLRLVDQRHTRNGIADLLVAGPLASLLIARGWPKELQAAVERFLEAWLRGLLFHSAPSGDGVRIGLRTLIEFKVATGDQKSRELAEANAAGLAVRTSDAAGEQRDRRQPRTTGKPQSQHVPKDALPDELTQESTLKFLALLGADLGASGEALLRRVAENDPARLLVAVETRHAGVSLAQYDPGLLIDLVDAYYIDADHCMDDAMDEVYVAADGMAYTIADALPTGGIRNHEFDSRLGVLTAAYWRGPFGAMLRRDFTGGTGCLNRLLNHAAKVEMQRCSIESDDSGGDGAGHRGVRLSITGEPRHYEGDISTWQWYRGNGLGPCPCTSALQALELVCDEILERQSMAPAELIRTLLSGCENLAMLGLAHGVMVRHFERFDGAIDAFLAEPHIWKMEARRVNYESWGNSGSAPVAVAERRMWRPLETVAQLVAAADESRAQELKRTGTAFLERATNDIGGTHRASEELAIVQKWARAFDRDEYETTRSAGDLEIRLREDPEIEAALAKSGADHRRRAEASRLAARYANRYDNFQGPDPLDAEELEGDIAAAKALIDGPSFASPFERDAGPAAVAAAALEGCFLDDMPIDEDHLVWAARTLAAAVQTRLADHPLGSSLTLPDPMGPDRSAARGLPLLLRPDAQPVLDRLAAEGLNRHDFHEAVLWLVTGAPNETRYAASQALDSVWRYPCRQPAECFHREALDLIEESTRHSTALVRWTDGPHEPRPLVGPILDALGSATAESVVASCLNPALRALGAETGNPTCVHGPATELLEAAPEVHRRARRAIDIGSDFTRSDALFAARALLARSAVGQFSALREHMAGLADHFNGLRECLMALAAAAEESTETAETAREVWPEVIREGLRILDMDNRRGPHGSSGRDTGQAMVFWALLPSTASNRMYMYREMLGGRISWIDPESWALEIDLWVRSAIGNLESVDSASGPKELTPRRAFRASGLIGCIDAMIGMLSALPVDQQARIGIHWVKMLVVGTGEPAARTMSLPEWLQEVRPHLKNEEQKAWRDIVDHLLVHGDGRVSGLAD